MRSRTCIPACASVTPSWVVAPSRKNSTTKRCDAEQHAAGVNSPIFGANFVPALDSKKYCEQAAAANAKYSLAAVTHLYPFVDGPRHVRSLFRSSSRR